MGKENKKWLIYTRGNIYLHRFDNVLSAFVNSLNKNLFLYPVTSLLFISEKNKLWFAWRESEMNEYAAKLLKLIQSPKRFKVRFVQLFSISKKIIKISENINGRELKECTNKQLSDIYDFLSKNVGGLQLVLGADIDCVDICFESFLLAQLKKQMQTQNPESLLSIYKEISQPVYTSYILAKNLALMRAAKYQNYGHSALKIYKKYWWTSLGWENMEVESLSDFQNQIETYKKRKNLKNEISHILDQKTKIKKRRETLIKKHNLSSEVQHLLKVVDNFALLHDLRKESQVKITYCFHLLLLEVSRRTGYKPDDLEWLWYREIKMILAGKKLNRSILEQRKKAHFIWIKNRQLVELVGSKAIAAKNKILKENSSKNSEIKGLGVTNGKAVGVVRVCSGYKEAIKKVKKSEILVTGMTLPDYVPAMKKASGIITDEGGITCHAAIVSRELKKVCIVGTKIATKVLKDGDLVEVDANKGIVKILKKA